MAKMSAGYFAKQKGITKEQFATPFKQLANITNLETLKSIKLGKFAQIASTFSIILPLVFGIAPMRNFMTLSSSGTKDFTTVIGLKAENEQKQKKMLNLKL